MSGWLVLATVLALIGLARGAQVLATQLGRYPTDVRRPGALIRMSWSKPVPARSPELRRLVTIISYATIDDRSSKAELLAVFKQLDAPVSPLVDGEVARRGRLRRSQQIDEAITALERRYGL
ncbi:MAG: hypothetical protein AAGA65_01065 [Actinomycetota bacterium]